MRAGHVWVIFFLEELVVEEDFFLFDEEDAEVVFVDVEDLDFLIIRSTHDTQVTYECEDFFWSELPVLRELDFFYR